MYVDFLGGKVRYIWLFPAIVLFTKNDAAIIDLYVFPLGIFSSACSRSCRKRMRRTCCGSTSQKRNCNRRIHWPVPSFPDPKDVWVVGTQMYILIHIYIYIYICHFHPEKWGRWSNLRVAYFSKGSVKKHQLDVVKNGMKGEVFKV